MRAGSAKQHGTTHAAVDGTKMLGLPVELSSRLHTYVSAGGASLGMLAMTAAAPIYHDVAKAMFAGVVAIDFSLADLDQSILVNGRIQPRMT